MAVPEGSPPARSFTSGGRGRLVALLASPPTTSGARTERKVRQALQVLGADRYVIANLYAFPVKDLPALSISGAHPAGWLSARPKLTRAVREADILLAAWGLHRLNGRARRLQHDQFAWLRDLLSRAGHSTAWCVGGRARHPSRWHQYVSDRHGRTTCSPSFEERLDQVIAEVPLQLLLGHLPPTRGRTASREPEGHPRSARDQRDDRSGVPKPSGSDAWSRRRTPA